jgi:hypothetical protein
MLVTSRTSGSTTWQRERGTELMIALGIAGDFLSKVSAVGWGDVLWALEEGVMSPKAALRLAELRAEAGDERPDLLALAGLAGDDSESIHEAVRQLAAGDERGTGQPDSRSKWLGVVLAWIRSRPDLFPDPLATAESIYADFDYPAAMKGFIRYMPRQPGLEGESREEAAHRMMRNWDAFLEREGEGVGWQP